MSRGYLEILMDWFPDGNYSEQDLWDAIAEAEGVDVSEISDRDLTEFIQNEAPVEIRGFFFSAIYKGENKLAREYLREINIYDKIGLSFNNQGKEKE